MADNTISSVSYTYDEYFLNLAKKYFNINDISTLKSGLFGYITNTSSHIAKNTTFHRNMLYNEFFLNTAVMHDSVINWAKILNYEIDMSIPSSCKVSLRLDMSAVLSSTAIPYSRKETYNVYTISKDQIFLIDKVKFMLPYEVEIYANYNGSTLSTYAKYKLNPTYANYEDPNITSDEIKVVIEGNYANIILDIYQLEKTTTVFDVLSDDILQSYIFDVNFTNNLSTFKAEYQTATDKLQKNNVWYNLIPVFSEIDTPLTTYYCYYNIISDTALRVYFSTTAGTFKPEFNSKIRVTTYTSLGEDGNFRYQGNIALSDSIFTSVGYTCVNLSDPANGTNQLDFINTKKQLMNELRTRKNYSTEQDINLLFSNLSLNAFNNKINSETIKYRDDIFKRIYTIYSLLTLDDGSIVPTNTIDLEIPISVVEELNFVIKPGTFIIYDRINSIYRLLDKTEFPDSYLYNNDSYIYVIPYLLNFDFNQFPKINTYITNYSRNFPCTVDSTKIHPDFYSILNINYLTISRNTVMDVDSFLIEVPVLGNINDLNTIAVVLVIYDNNIPIAETRLEFLPSTNTFYKRVYTNDEFSLEGAYIITNSFYSYGTDNLISNFKITKEFKAAINVYDNRTTNLFTSTLTGTLLTAFNLKEPISFARSLNESMHIDLSINSNTGKILLGKVPLIGATAFFNNKYNKDIYSSLYKLFYESDNASNLLDNNTSFDIKFYNTYGLSNNFTIDTVDIRIRIQLKLTIQFNQKFETDLKMDIAQFIRNSNYTLDKRFSLSNLFTYLENKYTEISYIKTFTINNANIQNIEIIPDIKQKLATKYIPELLNVRKLNKTDYYGNDYTYDISIDYL